MGGASSKVYAKSSADTRTIFSTLYTTIAMKSSAAAAHPGPPNKPPLLFGFRPL
jgi:hypothetical protein